MVALLCTCHATLEMATAYLIQNYRVSGTTSFFRNGAYSVRVSIGPGENRNNALLSANYDDATYFFCQVIGRHV